MAKTKKRSRIDKATFDYIRMLENPGNVGYKDGIWRPPTDSTKYDIHQIGPGLDMREEHNPYVYNYLKSHGRLDNPWLTDDEVFDLVNQTWDSKAALYDSLINKYGDKISDRGRQVLAAMAWHGHPFKMVNSPDSITGKAFINALATGDRDLDTVFDAYYKYPANIKRFAARIAADEKFRKTMTETTTPDGNKRMTFGVDFWKDPEQLPVWMPQLTDIKTEYNPINNAPEYLKSWNGADAPTRNVSYPNLMRDLHNQEVEMKDRYQNMLDNGVSVFGNQSYLPSTREAMRDQVKDYAKDILFPNPFYDDNDLGYTPLRAKNGKDLPMFKDGKDGYKYIQTENGWARVTDGENEGAFEDVVVTPKGNKRVIRDTLGNSEEAVKQRDRLSKMEPLRRTGEKPVERGLEQPLFDPFLIAMTGGRFAGDVVGDVIGDAVGRAAVPVSKALYSGANKLYPRLLKKENGIEFHEMDMETLSDAYKTAVESGDKAKALGILEQAYLRSVAPIEEINVSKEGFPIGWYHGSEWGNHTVFDSRAMSATIGGASAAGRVKGNFLTTDVPSAMRYAGHGRYTQPNVPEFTSPQTFKEKIQNFSGRYKPRRLYPAERVGEYAPKPERLFDTEGRPPIEHLDKTNHVVYPMYVNPGENPMILDFEGRPWSQSPIEFPNNFFLKRSVRDDIAKTYRDEIIPFKNYEDALKAWNEDPINIYHNKTPITDEYFDGGVRSIEGWNSSPRYETVKLVEELVPNTSNGAVQTAAKEGNSSVLMRNVIDSNGGPDGVHYAINDFVTLKPEQMKLADITYDDNGNLIPLTKRFNWGNKDIRYGLLPWIFGAGTFSAALYNNNTFKRGKDIPIPNTFLLKTRGETAKQTNEK